MDVYICSGLCILLVVNEVQRLNGADEMCIPQHDPVFAECEISYVPVFLGGIMKACNNTAPINIKSMCYLPPTTPLQSSSLRPLSLAPVPR